MKRIIEILTGIAALAAMSTAAGAATLEDTLTNAAASAESAVSVTGLPLWGVLAISLALLAVVLFALSRGSGRRRGPSVIKTRLG